MGDEQRKALRELRARAEANAFNIHRLFEAAGTGVPAALSAPGLTIGIPMGFYITFTIEQHPEGWMRHVSVSVDGKRGSVPNNFAIEWIARELGFRDNEPHLAFLENEREAHPAVNWMQKTAAPGESD